MKPCLLLFDIDGTLLSAGGCGRVALERAFEKTFGHPNAWGETTACGKTDLLICNEISQRLLGRVFKAHEWVEFSERYTQYFAEEAEHSIRFKTTPGAFKLLEYLSDIPGVHLALATGNIEKVSWIKLRKVRLHPYFRCGGFGHNHTERTGILRDALLAAQNHFRGKFPKSRTFVIGDTAADVKAAHALKLRSIGVETGATKGREFDHTHPHHRLADFNDLDLFMRALDHSS